MASDLLTMPGLLRHNAAVHRDRPAMVTETASLTHAQLDRDSATLARRLVALGVGSSSRVGLVMENGTQWAVIAAAIMRIGAIVVPLSTLLKPPELLSQLQTATVTELIMTPGFLDRDYLDDLELAAPGVREQVSEGRRHVELPNLRRVWLAGELTAHPVDAEILMALEDSVRPADDLVVLFTSGSRGTPKGVIHTHGGAIRAVAAGLACRCVGPEERLYIPMPFFWTGGFSGGLMTALVAGATLLTEAAPEVGSTLELLQRERATLFRGWPDQAARLASHPDFASVSLSHLGPGSLPAVLPPQLQPAPGARANLFGMTETFGPYCGDRLDIDLPPEKYGSCGRPFDGLQVRVVDLESGIECPPGADGEISVRGPTVMRGICGRTRAETFDADGFYRTGDIGAVDAEGYLWYRSRRDDMFKIKGATVYPSEVEGALRGLVQVLEAFVTNVAGEAGDRVGALVITSLAPAALDTAVRTRLSSFKVPTLWYVTERIEDVPRSASDKVDKAALQSLIERHGTRMSGEATANSAPQKGT